MADPTGHAVIDLTKVQGGSPAGNTGTQGGGGGAGGEGIFALLAVLAWLWNNIGIEAGHITSTATENVQDDPHVNDDLERCWGVCAQDPQPTKTDLPPCTTNCETPPCTTNCPPQPDVNPVTPTPTPLPGGSGGDGKDGGMGKSTGSCDGKLGSPDNMGRGTVFGHFTNAAGATGITGFDANSLSVGQSVYLSELCFGQGANDFMSSVAGDIFVTDLGADASVGQLARIGVFGDKANFVIQFSQEAALMNGARAIAANASRGIYTIPGGSILKGFSFILTRLR
jgi:hypothetical protein